MRGRTASRANTLIEIVVVLAVLAILATVVLRWYGGRGGAKTMAEKTKTPIGKAKGVDCMNNMQQIGLALQAASVSNDQPVQDINVALKNGVSKSMMVCPETGQPYRFDPQKKIVFCTTPGHGQVVVHTPGF